MCPAGANDDQNRSLSLAEAEALLGEIVRLRSEIANLEGQVGQLNQLAYRDPLVNLPNRRSFLHGLQGLIARVERYKTPCSILFIDVDGLKKINDHFGHTAGDQALMEIAQALVGCVRRTDSVARIGGDEFGVLLEGTDELGAWQMGLRIVESVVGHTFRIDGNALPLSVAVGVGMIEAGDDVESVLGRADKEMYRVKAA